MCQRKQKNDNKILTNRYGERFSSTIRDIKIFLPDNDTKDVEDEENLNFVGRERVSERLFNWLSKSGQGSYLVTGFRGMGKSTIVKRTIDRLTKEINHRDEIIFKITSAIGIGLIGIICCSIIVKGWHWHTSIIDDCFGLVKSNNVLKNLLIVGISIIAGIVINAIIAIIIGIALIILKCNFNKCFKNKLKLRLSKLEKGCSRNGERNKKCNRRDLKKEYPDYDRVFIKKLVRGNRIDCSKQEYKNIEITVNLGHEVLQERDILGLIATNIRDKYKEYINCIQPRQGIKLLNIVGICILSVFLTCGTKAVVENTIVVENKISKDNSNHHTYPYISYSNVVEDNNKKATYIEDNWFARTAFNTLQFCGNLYKKYPILCLFLLYILWFFCLKKILYSVVRTLPLWGTPARAIKRLDILADRIVATTDEESGGSHSFDKSLLSITIFNRRRRKTMPIANIREIETELASIINDIADNCTEYYQAQFFIVFDEMDKIDPANVEPSKNEETPEFTDSVKGFPDGMDSRKRRRNVLRLLANIKLFVNTAKAKFVFISGRELYDAYLADLSDRDFAISSIFSGVINVDSFLTPEGGQTDVRSMSEWYIANRLIPREWMEAKEDENAINNRVLKQEKPSLKWYYEYLISRECKTTSLDATFAIGFLHTFAAYLTHISNGSPKKIFLYFEKYIRDASECLPMNDWQDTCIVGQREKDSRKVLYFDAIQQRTINFVYYLANPIMGTITNDLSNYGDRFLVSLSFIIDHIYKHHSRSFSWRNMEQIPDLLKTSKAPELRDSVMSLMEYLTQIHISPVLIGLNEYKFHKSIAEEISVISKLSDEASAIFNFTLDESLSVIQHNTRLLNYYRELAEKDSVNPGSHKSDEYNTIIARIHSNLGDLHYWDEDYYAATLDYRAAINLLPDNKSNSDEFQSYQNFLTRIRCLLKLGLTYEMRKLYPNAYQIYCSLVDEIISKRWIQEDKFGLRVLDTYTDGWRGKRQTLLNSDNGQDGRTKFQKQFENELYSNDDDYSESKYMTNVDGVISSFAKNLTPEKSKQVNSLTLFEEIRYVYQSILAKLSILEKMGMSGITQTNIDVAEGEFMAIHKSVNIREKFIISADFFRKLAEILYYKNSLTILSQNQQSLYASVYYGDYDLLATLDDYCMYGNHPEGSNILEIKQDVKFFFNWLNNDVSGKNKKEEGSSDVTKAQQGNSKNAPQFSYEKFREGNDKKTLKKLFDELKRNVDADDGYLKVLYDPKYETPLFKTLPKDQTKRSSRIEKLKKNIVGYLDYNLALPTVQNEQFFFGSLDCCDCHRNAMRGDNLRPACYACKYYTRSLRILAENMFENDENNPSVLLSPKTKSLGILRQSFKNRLLYTNSNSIRTLALTLEGFGNVMFSCASGNNYEKEVYKPKHGIHPLVVGLLSKLIDAPDEKNAKQDIEDCENNLGDDKLSRLDKSILYFWDAYRFYIIDGNYHEASGCLKKIVTILSYYIQVLCYYSMGNNKLGWSDESETIRLLVVGDNNDDKPFLDKLFSLVARYTGYKYDHINITEINELKWIYSKELSDNIDLTKLSIYPDIRSTWLRIAEIKAKGFRYLKHSKEDYQLRYLNHIVKTYPLIAPLRRNETTFYEEVLAYYTKVRYHDHILNNILGGNPMVDHKNDCYAEEFHILFYRNLAKYLSSGEDVNRLDYMLFGTTSDVEDRLNLIEFLILDTLVCITNMVKVFTPHNHLTSYSKSFIAIVYNYYWEWARKYEFLYSLYQYQEAKVNVGDVVDYEGDDNKTFNCRFECEKSPKEDNKVRGMKKMSGKINREDNCKAESIIKSIAGGIRRTKSSTKTVSQLEKELRDEMDKCSSLITSITEKKELLLRYGRRSDRLYERLRHEIDDITINTIFSNYTAEMALRYYQLSDEANTEGEAYTEMISSLHFLNDDLNNDTCQFNIACDRFLLNTGVVASQRSRLELLYKVSQVYGLQNAYIDGPNAINEKRVRSSDFKRSNWLNSEYL